MIDKALQVFDAPMCCSTGVCGPEVDPALVRFAADVGWLKSQGVVVVRYNPSQEPNAFVTHHAVRRALQQFGSKCLPLVLWGEETLTSGGYPDRGTLERALGLSPVAEEGGVA
jgi:hypothetical protein